MEYPQILAAVEQHKKSTWDVVDAIVSEAKRSRTGQRLANGESERISKFLAEHDYKWSPVRIRQLYTIGWWVKDHPKFREYSVARAIQVRQAVGIDYVKAEVMLASDKPVRQIGSETIRLTTLLKRSLALVKSVTERVGNSDEALEPVEHLANQLEQQVKTLKQTVKDQAAARSVDSHSTNTKSLSSQDGSS